MPRLGEGLRGFQIMSSYFGAKTPSMVMSMMQIRIMFMSMLNFFMFM